MKHTLEKLWDEYFAEECAVIDTEEERMFLRKAAEVHKKASELLTKEQNNAIEKYKSESKYIAFIDIDPEYSCALCVGREFSYVRVNENIL